MCCDAACCEQFSISAIVYWFVQNVAVQALAKEQHTANALNVLGY